MKRHSIAASALCLLILFGLFMANVNFVGGFMPIVNESNLTPIYERFVPSSFFETQQSKLDFQILFLTGGASASWKDFSLVIEGDETLRNELIGNYELFVESELDNAALNIMRSDSTSRDGVRTSFTMQYEDSVRGGVFHVTSSRVTDDRFCIDIFIYEHN